MKLLKTKKTLLAIFFSNLRMLKTEQFKTDDEMEQYRNKIKPALVELLDDYCLLWDKAKEVSRLFSLEKINQVEAQKMVNENNNKFAKLDVLNENKEVELSLEDADFNLFFDLFGKVGKTSFTNVDKYLDFKADLNATNMQLKVKKEK